MKVKRLHVRKLEDSWAPSNQNPLTARRLTDKMRFKIMVHDRWLQFKDNWRQHYSSSSIPSPQRYHIRINTDKLHSHPIGAGDITTILDLGVYIVLGNNQRTFGSLSSYFGGSQNRKKQNPLPPTRLYVSSGYPVDCNPKRSYSHSIADDQRRNKDESPTKEE